eukprot:403349312
MNIPILEHQLEALAKTGIIKDVILAINQVTSHLLIKEILDHFRKKFHIRIILSVEMEPLGTLGPVKLAKDLILDKNHDGCFFVLNSDIVIGGSKGEDLYPLQQMALFHGLHGKKATILTTKVQDPWKYGEIIQQEDGKIISIVEKPNYFVSDQVNAGIYLLSNEVFDDIGLNQENIVNNLFYTLKDQGELYAFALNEECYWMDIGNPQDYLQAQKMVLDHIHTSSYLEGELIQSDISKDQTSDVLNPETQMMYEEDFLLQKQGQTAKQYQNLHQHSHIQKSYLTQSHLQEQFAYIIPPVLIHDTALVHPSSVIGPHVVIGPRTFVGPGCKIQNSTIMSDCNIQGNSLIKDSIIGWRCTVGMWCRIQNTSVTGEDVQIENEVMLDSHMISPHLKITRAKIEAMEENKNYKAIII